MERGIGRIGGNWGSRRDGLLGTGEAAKAVGIDRSTLRKWWKQGRCTPEWVTQGGQARWDVEKLRRQLGYPPYRD